MPTKRPISYHEAILIFVNRTESALKARDYGKKPGQYAWYVHNFVQCISDMNCHIELTGDEIEPVHGISEIRT